MIGLSSRGDDIQLAIERGLEASSTLVLCLSPVAMKALAWKLARPCGA
jgi:hypothetical protein